VFNDKTGHIFLRGNILFIYSTNNKLKVTIQPHKYVFNVIQYSMHKNTRMYDVHE